MEVPMEQWLPSLEIDMAAQVQILVKAVCILHWTNTLGKVMNPTILLPAVGK